MELWLGMALAALGIMVAAWDGWLTLKVNRNVIRAMNPDRPTRRKRDSKVPAIPRRTAPPPLPLQAGLPENRSLHQIQLPPAPVPKPLSPPSYCYNRSAPDMGEGRKLLERGLGYLQAGNPSLALPLLYQSMEILTRGGTQREIVAARMAIERAENTSPNFFRRAADAESYRPKPGRLF